MEAGPVVFMMCVQTPVLTSPGSLSSRLFLPQDRSSTVVVTTVVCEGDRQGGRLSREGGNWGIAEVKASCPAAAAKGP